MESASGAAGGPTPRCRAIVVVGVGRRQGPEGRGDRLRVERRHRRRLDRSRLQPRGEPLRRRGRRRPVLPGRALGRVPADALHRVRLLLHEPPGPGLRHHVQLGLRSRSGLGDHRRRRHRDGEPRPDRRPLQLPAGRDRRAVDPGGDLRRRDLDRDHDRHLLHRHRAVGADADRAARRRDPRARGLRRGRPGPGLRRRLPRLDRPEPRLAQPVQHRQHDRADRRSPDRGLHLLGVGQCGDCQRGNRGSDRRAGEIGGRLDPDPARDLRRRGIALGGTVPP